MSPSQFKILEDLEQTPRTVVSLVEEATTGRLFVFKRLRNPMPNPYELARLRQEFATIQKLNSPRIIQVVEWERLGEYYGIVMEYTGHGNLQKFLASGGKLEFSAQLQIAIELAEALQEVHRQGIIHRDINPRNILIDPETYHTKLIDFSIASQIQFDGMGEESRDKAFEGSLAYMSPEQTGRMNRQVDQRSDLYSLGITLFELFTGSLPFVADDLLGYFHAHIAKKPPLATALNPALPGMADAIVQRLLAKNVEERYQSAAGLLADLSAPPKSKITPN